MINHIAARRCRAGFGVLVLLAGAFLAFGLAPLAMPASYNWSEFGISESAGQGLEGAGPDLMALAITMCIPFFMSSGIWGVLQRVMFITAGLWYAREAWRVPSQPGPIPVRNPTP